MNKTINIKNNKAIKEIRAFKDKQYSMMDIRFQNVHLRKINELVRLNIFSKNDIYINSMTLWELMQPIGETGSHNFHGLTPEDIWSAINGLSNPNYVFISKYGRYMVVPVMTSAFKEPLMVVIETGSGLVENPEADINKIVTIYPKSDIDELLNKISQKDILFRK